MFNLSCIKNCAMSAYGRARSWEYKNRPTILTIVGVVTGVAATVTAVVQTTKAESILDELNTDLENHKKVVEADPNSDIGKKREERGYTEKDAKIDKFKLYLRAGLKFAKLYSVPIMLSTVSVCCILGSHGIMSQRNAIVTSQLASAVSGFKEYRSRVVDIFGKEADEEIRYGKKRPVPTVDQVTGEKIIEEAHVVSEKEPAKTSWNQGKDHYTFLFDRTTSAYHDILPMYNLEFLKRRQRELTDQLRRERRPITINDVLDALGMYNEKTFEGQFTGWCLDCPDSDDFIDFGLTKAFRERPADSSTSDTDIYDEAFYIELNACDISEYAWR